MSVPSFSASSTLSVAIRALSASTNLGWMPLVTISRLDAVQRWPVEKKAL